MAPQTCLSPCEPLGLQQCCLGCGVEFGAPVRVNGLLTPKYNSYPLKYCQPARAKVPAEVGVDTGGLKPHLLQPPQSRACSTRRWGFWSGPLLPPLSPQTWGSPRSAHLALLPVLPTASPGPSTQGPRPPGPGGEPLLGPARPNPKPGNHRGRSPGTGTGFLGAGGGPAEACSCGVGEQGSSVPAEEPQKRLGGGTP